MVFAVYGLVKHKGKKIANGFDGKFETNDERIILLLKQKGFKENAPEESKPVRKLGRTKSKEPK